MNAFSTLLAKPHKKEKEKKKKGMTYGSPMIKLSPALIDGTRPSEPTRAAAPSLRSANCQMSLQKDVEN